MKRVPYIDYKKLKGNYTVYQVAAMFNLDLEEMLIKGQQYGIRPRWDGVGNYLFNSTEIKDLHHRLYYESRGRRV